MSSGIDISIQADDPLIGRKLGNYQITALIAKGGMGSVYLAEHPEIGSQAAVKVLFPSLTAQPGFAERFVAEAKVLARLDHPNVIQIFDFGRTGDGQLYYVMELLKGGDLAGLLADRGMFAAADAWPIVEQICSALQAAHDHGIVHRDLKLENIHLQRRKPPTIKLLDFGIAKILEGGGNNQWRTTTGMVVGTPVFMSPEQAAGRADQIGIHTDIYALGVLLYLLLTGEPPFWADTAPELLCKHLHDPPPPLVSGDPSLPADIAEIAKLCLAKAPADRPASARDVAMAFASALGVEVDDPVLNGPATGEVPIRITAERRLPSGSDQTARAPSGVSPLAVASTSLAGGQCVVVDDEGRDPTVPATPLRRAAAGLTGPPQPTTISTLSSSVGEVWPDGTFEIRRRPLLRYILVGALIGGLATAGLLAYSYLGHESAGDRPAGGGQAPAAARGSAGPGALATPVPDAGGQAKSAPLVAPDGGDERTADAEPAEPPAAEPETKLATGGSKKSSKVSRRRAARLRVARARAKARAQKAKAAAAKKARAAAAKKAKAAAVPAAKVPPTDKKPPKKVGAGTMDF